MQITKVGTSFLDDHPINSLKSKKSHQHYVYNYARDRKPIITPVLKANHKDEEGQQFLLIPNKDHILVLSMEHGQTVCKLVPYHDNKEGVNDYSNSNSRTIETASIVKHKCDVEGGSHDGVEWVIMAGFSDGVLQEWVLSSVTLSSSKSSTILPHRTFKLPDEFSNTGISHISSPVGGEDGLLYALVKNNSPEDKKECHFMRINVPGRTGEDVDGKNLIQLNDFSLLATFSKQLGSHTEINGCNDDETTIQSNRFSVQTLPFALMSVSCERKGATVNYVAIVDNRSLTIYYENTFSSQSRTNIDRFVRYTQLHGQGGICAAAMAPNGEDMAFGYNDGKIDIFVSILSQTSSYIDDLSSSKEHPGQNLLKRTIHWHALPVKTLCYLGMPGSRAAPNLLSGGEESVLVTWNIERGLNRPTYTLPRLSKGCMTHIATNAYPMSTSSGTNNMDIVVRCMDNTLQLIQGHNHAIRWKIQGLACPNNECVEAVAPGKQIPSVLLQVDPKSGTPIMTRLAGAPGFIHWYDLTSNQVVGELEVAPYNRISRKEAHHNAYPRPTVTNFVISSSGNDLITVDTMLTENTFVGKACEAKAFVKGGDDLSEKMSLVINIKFWTWSREMEKRKIGDQQSKEMPYELISAMPNPHGHVTGEIDGLAISPLGNRACSISHEEGTFHIWGKGKTVNSERNELSPILPSWKRLCKITIPAGYSNLPNYECGQDKNSTVTFSSDGSVLAIAFGQNVTVWDHSNATLLNTIRAPDYLCDIKFVRSPLDMMLAVGKSSVSIVAPFSGGYLGNDCWSYKLPEKTIVENKQIELGLVTPLVARKELAVAIKQTEKKGKINLISTKIVLIDIMTGQSKKRKDGSLCNWHLEGNVQSLCDISQSQSSWASEDAVLLVLTENSEMFVLDPNSNNHDNANPIERISERGCFSHTHNNTSSALSSTDAPKIQMMSSRKRRSDKIELSVVRSPQRSDEISTVGKGSLVFDSSESTSISTSQLPALTGNFTQSFIARKFRKVKQISRD